MSTFKEKCEQFFGTSDFYEVLSISKDATAKNIKKAYHKLSLLVHPDRVDENHKEDKDKRNIYDECGDIDDDDDADFAFNWKEYWFSMFKKIEIEDIRKFEREYIGSDTERRDIKRAYEGSKGNMNVLLEMVPFSNCEGESRYIEIVREMVDGGEVEEYKSFFNESKVKRLRRHRKYEKERKEAEMIKINDLEKDMEANMKRRGEAFGNLIADLEQKYAPKKSRKSLTDGSEKKSSKSRRKYLRSKSRRHRKRVFKTKRFWSDSDIADLVPFIASLFL